MLRSGGKLLPLPCQNLRGTSVIATSLYISSVARWSSSRDWRVRHACQDLGHWFDWLLSSTPTWVLGIIVFCTFPELGYDIKLKLRNDVNRPKYS